MAESQAKTIMWLSPMCSLDQRSGAALQIRSILTTLAEVGWEAHAMEMTQFDGREPYPVSTIIGNAYADPAYHGKVFRFQYEGVQHQLLYTASTFRGQCTDEEVHAFYKQAVEAIQAVRPDVVITYGQGTLMEQLYVEARKVATTMVFFLANQAYSDPSLFKPFDQVLVQSDYMRGYYRDKIGIESDVLPLLISSSHYPDPDQVLGLASPENRGLGYIAMVNPSTEKGAMLFARLVYMAGQRRPDWTFLTVESRMTDKEWQQSGVDIPNQPNVFWIANQQEMRRVYERTSILLFPSFIAEGAGLCIAEAQLAGIPVLASSHGGPPEILNGGGFQFDIPQRCRENHLATPTEEEIEPWFDTLETLMDDESAFREASRRAQESGAWLHPDKVREEVVERFGAYAAGQGLRPPFPQGKPSSAAKPVVKEEEPGRNDPCPCGSGKKYKKCCMIRPATGQSPPQVPATPESGGDEKVESGEEKSAKTLVFTITPGWTGTLFLTQLFTHNVAAARVYHEHCNFMDFGVDTPDASDLMQLNNAGVTAKVRAFWERKLQRVLEEPGETYVEMAHVLAKAGLVDNLDLLPNDVDVRLIHLTRPPEEVAWRFFEQGLFENLDWTWLFTLDPRYANLMIRPDPFGAYGTMGWCLWYALEMEARAAYYEELIAGWERVAMRRITTPELRDTGKARDLLAWIQPERAVSEPEIPQVGIPAAESEEASRVSHQDRQTFRGMIQELEGDPAEAGRELFRAGFRLAAPPAPEEMGLPSLPVREV